MYVKGGTYGEVIVQYLNCGGGYTKSVMIILHRTTHMQISTNKIGKSK